MVVMLNDLYGFRDIGWITEQMKTMAHDTYPEQHPAYVGHRMRIDCMDYKNGHRRWKRLNINKEFYKDYDGLTTEDLDRWWDIVRFDMDRAYEINEAVGNLTEEEIQASHTIDNVVYVPGKALLISYTGDVIVCSTADIKRLMYYPRYTRSKNEVNLKVAESWQEYNLSERLDKVHPVPVQRLEYIGRTAAVEYYNDIIKCDSIVNMLPESPDQHPTFEQIKERLLKSHEGLKGMEDLKNAQDVIVKSFPHYYPRHEKSMIDIPRRAINMGKIIRCDEKSVIGPDGIVVKEEVNGTTRYITGSEAYIYVIVGEE